MVSQRLLLCSRDDSRLPCKIFTYVYADRSPYTCRFSAYQTSNSCDNILDHCRSRQSLISANRVIHINRLLSRREMSISSHRHHGFSVACLYYIQSRTWSESWFATTLCGSETGPRQVCDIRVSLRPGLRPASIATN